MSKIVYPDNIVDNQPLPDNSGMVILGVRNTSLDKSFEDLGKQYDLSGPFAANAQKVDAARWNRLYPYQLVVCQLSGGRYTATGLKFTLPMTPQELSISTPFAITNTITADGVAEEHSGVKVKSISFSGSLGSAPLRGHVENYPASPPNPFAQAIAGGTISAVNDLNQAVSDFANGPNLRPIDNYIKEFSETDKSTNEKYAPYASTGYVQHLLLDKFLHGYASLKATSGGESYRLAFCMWKDNTVYLVTPVSYSMKRSASSPGEYTYDLQLKAWKQITIEGSDGTLKATVENDVTTQSASDALKKLQEARTVIYKSRAAVDAVRGDADRLMNVVREMILAAKDTVGVAKTVIDLPSALRSDYQILIEKQAVSLLEDIKSLSGDTYEQWRKVI